MNTQTYMQKLESLAARSISSYSYIHSLLEELKPHLPFAGACCTNIDPYRLRSTGAVVAHNMESIHHQLLTLPCSPIQVCVPVREHDYIDITAYALYSHTSSIQLMIAIQSASPLDILPWMMEDYYLSEREKQIIDQMIEGLSTCKIADILHLSPYAVEENLQSIFAKTKTTSRRELIARLLSQTDCIISR